jgi:outer membrane lipoprotein-sorting protein
MMVKYETYNDKDQVTMSMVTSDIKIDPKLDEARFKFVKPDGVEVMDMSKMGQMGGGMGGENGAGG